MGPGAVAALPVALLIITDRLAAQVALGGALPLASHIEQPEVVARLAHRGVPAAQHGIPRTCEAQDALVVEIVFFRYLHAHRRRLDLQDLLWACNQRCTNRPREPCPNTRCNRKPINNVTMPDVFRVCTQLAQGLGNSTAHQPIARLGRD
jgi:hypothetical protein